MPLFHHSSEESRSFLSLVSAEVRENSLWRIAGTPMNKYKPEQIVTLLRQIEVEIANGKTTPARSCDLYHFASPNQVAVALSKGNHPFGALSPQSP